MHVNHWFHCMLVCTFPTLHQFHRNPPLSVAWMSPWLQLGGYSWFTCHLSLPVITDHSYFIMRNKRRSRWKEGLGFKTIILNVMNNTAAEGRSLTVLNLLILNTRSCPVLSTRTAPCPVTCRPPARGARPAELHSEICRFNVASLITAWN